MTPSPLLGWQAGPSLRDPRPWHAVPLACPMSTAAQTRLTSPLLSVDSGADQRPGFRRIQILTCPGPLKPTYSSSVRVPRSGATHRSPFSAPSCVGFRDRTRGTRLGSRRLSPCFLKIHLYYLQLHVWCGVDAAAHRLPAAGVRLNGLLQVLSCTEPHVLFLLCVSHLLEKAGPWAKPTPEVTISGLGGSPGRLHHSNQLTCPFIHSVISRGII